MPRVAVIGRQNVGKSTLVNRLVGRREAIADEAAGVTRDRLELESTWRGRTFRVVDTGGYVHRARGIEALVSAQAERAAADADVILLVVDAQTGIREEDEMLARRLRRVEPPVVVAANKVDADRDEADAAAFARLGLGAPIVVSALHGRNAGDLLDRIVSLLPPGDGEREADRPAFALVGRANVGKSSLFNRLVGDERSVVFSDPGTTRDAVDADVHWPSGDVRFLDTAGFRRASRAAGIEYYSFLRTVRAIERAHVVGLVIDGSDGFTTEDKRIAARVMELGRALVVIANKWDLVEDRDRAYKRLEGELAPFAHARAMRTSALSGTGVGRLPSALMDLHARWSHRAPTAAVNDVLERAQSERAAARGGGRVRYATQVSAGPPSFVLFGTKAPPAPYRRFLEGRLRRAFELDGVPIRLAFRSKRSSGRRDGGI